MRHDLTATDCLINAELRIHWPTRAHAALGALISPYLSPSPGRLSERQLKERVIDSKESADWEWQKEDFHYHAEDGEAETEEVLRDLTISNTELERVERGFDLARALCQGFGIPADLSLSLPDGTSRFAQTRPWGPQASRPGALARLWSREHEEPRSDLTEMLALAMNSDSIEEMRQALRDALDDERAPGPVEPSIDAFEALWPGDSFESAAAYFTAVFRQRWLREVELSEIEPHARGANAFGQDPIAFAFDARGWLPWSVAPAVKAANLLAQSASGEPQALALRAMAARLIGSDGASLGMEAQPFLEGLCARADRGEPIDFSGPIGQALNAGLRPAPPHAKPEEQAAWARLEALLLKAQTLPVLQSRKNAGQNPPARAVLRV